MLGFCSGFAPKQRFAPKEKIKNHLSQSPEPSEFIGGYWRQPCSEPGDTFWSIQPYIRHLLCAEYQTR